MVEEPDTATGSGEAAKAAHPAQPRRSRWWFWATLVAVFVCGALTGSLITVGAVHHFVAQPFRSPDAMASRIANHMRKDLVLNDEQVEKIRDVLTKHIRFIGETLRKDHDAMTAEVEEFLTDEQVAKYRQMTEERRKHFPRPER